jgi:erythromycin esterase-like protein
MFQTLQALIDHIESANGTAKVVVWEHNSHLGDARATEMGRRGELNVGQLVRQAYGEQAVLIGFTTYEGSVTAASDWDEPAEPKWVRPAFAESYEALFHRVGVPRFFLKLRDGIAIPELADPRLERAIGVVYRPQTERLSHYFFCELADQFDAIVHIDETHALEPLERTPVWEMEEPPVTYPTAL